MVRETHPSRLRLFSLRQRDRSKFSHACQLSWLVIAAVLFGTVSGCGWLRQFADRPAAMSQHWASEARLAEQAGENERAEKLLRSAVETQQDDAGVHWQLAEFLTAQGRRDEAIAELEIARRLGPDDTRLAVELARAYLQSSQPSRAAGPLADALEADEQNVEALLLMGQLAELEDRQNDALETYHRILQQQPEHFAAKMRLAAIQLRSKNPEQAAPLLRSICQCPLSTTEQQAQALWMLGLAYGREQRWQDAENALARAIEHRTNVTADDWYRLGFVHYLLKELEAV